MRPSRPVWHPLARLLSLAVVLVISLSTGVTSASRQAVGTTQTTANGIVLQAGNPLPVFKFTKPDITTNTTFQLTQRFEAIYARQQVLQDTYLDNPRFTMALADTNSLLEQYGATGGFYAYNFREAFAETPRNAIDTGMAQLLACQFLLQNKLFPSNVMTPDTQNCDFDPQAGSPYQVNLVNAAAQGAASGSPTNQTTVGAMVQVPMLLPTGQYSQIPSVPLGGPGGHISLLFRTTDTNDTNFSLDSSVPGLAAVAMPFHGRSFEYLRNVPAVDVGQTKQTIAAQVRASYPDAKGVVVPEPALEYIVSDAAEEQTALEPMLNFEGIQVIVDGTTIFLRSIMVPAIVSGEGGFGPTVTITAPANNSTYQRDARITLTGKISGGTAPYIYSWVLDDGTVLHSSTSGSDGSISFVTTLPTISHAGRPAPVSVHLRVQDSEGAERAATVSVRPQSAPAAYLPMVVKGQSQTGAAGTVRTATVQQNTVSAASSNYSYGVESGSDYPPYGLGGADLPGVVPDAGGFRSAMSSYGWNQTFSWNNASAWERDWRDCSLGGGDCSYGIDRTDFAYWAGHGSDGGIALASAKDSSWFPGTNARFQRVRWVGFASCLTLRAQSEAGVVAPIRSWFNAFQGAHMLLGFNSLMADVAFGPRVVDNMRVPTFFDIPLPWTQRTIREAWVLTAFQMNAGKPAYIYAVGSNGVNPVDNKLPQPGDALLPRPYPVASYHWVWWNDEG